MFAAISALVVLVPFASALVVETPTDWQSSAPANISWVNSAGDPETFSVELRNPDIFHNSYAVGNNIPSSSDFFAFGMPSVDVGGGYYVQFVNISNINQVYAQSGEFSIAAPPASSSASGSTSASSASASSSGASSAASSTSPASSTGSSSIGSSSSTSAAGAAQTSGSGTFNGAARFDASLGSLAVAGIAAIAGAFVL